MAAPKQRLINKIKEFSIPRTVSVNSVVLLNDPQKIWYVDRGHISVSTVKTEHGVPIGRRRFLLNAKEGDILVGVNTPPNLRMGFVADAHEETILLEGNILHIKKLLVDEQLISLCIALLDHWIFMLFEALMEASVTQRAQPDIMADAGSVIEMQPKQLVSSSKPLLWCKASDLGSLNIDGILDLPAPAFDCYFPISKKSYFVASHKVKLEFFETKQVVKEKGFWHGLHLFHECVLAIELIEREIHEAQESQRLRDKYKSEQVRFDETLEEVASIFTKKDDEFGIDWEDQGNSLINACLIVAKHERIKLTIPESIDPSLDPLSEIMRYSRIRYREVVLDENWYDYEGGAILGFVAETEKPIAILPRPNGGYDAFDPETKEKVAITATNAKHVGNLGYVFYRPLPDNKPITLRELARFAFDGDKSDYVRIVLMGLVATVLSMLSPILTGVLFDHIIPNAERYQLAFVAMALLAATFSMILFEMTKAFAILRIEGRMDSRLQAALWDRLLDLPTTFFRQYTAGDLATRSMGINRIRRVLSGIAITSLLASLFSLLNFFLLFYYSTALALVALFLVFVQILILYRLGKMQVAKQTVYFEYQGQANGMVLQMLSGVAKFRVSGAETKAFMHWLKNFLNMKKAEVENAELQNLQHVINISVSLFTTIIIYSSIIYFVGEASMTTGEFLAFNAAYGTFTMATIAMSESMLSILQIVPIFDRTKPILQEPLENDSSKLVPDKLKGNIEISHVSFSYEETGPKILDDINVSVEAGDYIAFVGPSGSGKSTLIRLLLGFERPDAGAIMYDGQDLMLLDTRLLRREIGVVLQDGQLIPGDIYTNIVGSSYHLTIDDAWEAARMAGFAQDIEQMPMGMHTIISEGGTTLSGGQRQRLMIARAVVNKPKVLIFDEATSALDNRTQAIVTENLSQQLITRIVVAHRLSTIINADCIYYLKNGKIKEAGTYDELMKLNGEFAQLAQRQIE